MKVLSHEELQTINRKLDREFSRDLAQVERMLRDLLTMCLNGVHRQLIGGQIGLDQYYKDTQMVMVCAARLNDGED